MNRAIKVLVGLLLLATAEPGSAKDGDFDVKKKVRRYAKASLAPFIERFSDLKSLCREQNMLRGKWPTYTEAWKEWGPEEGKRAPDGYTKGEYLWTIVKDPAFRSMFMSGKVADELRDFQKASEGSITEIFVTDGRGGNIVQTVPTTDWFQGDEEKFSRTIGTKSISLDELEHDTSTGSIGIHVSVPIIDAGQVECAAIFLVVPDKLKK